MTIRITLLAAGGALLFSGAAMAYTFETAPTGGVVAQRHGATTFVTGGIGEEETVALENARAG